MVKTTARASSVLTADLSPVLPACAVDATVTHDDNDDAVTQQLVRKIDRRVIPLMFVTYVLNFMDKSLLSNASVFGLLEDNQLKGQDYSWVSSIFYFGYLTWAYPTTLLIARLPTGRYVGANTLAWGIFVAATAACSSYGGLLTVRVLLGAAEATTTPAFMFVTSTWYTRDEIPKRTSYWFAGNSAGGLVGGLVAYGLGHVANHHTLRPWRWMYIFAGSVTLLWAFALWAFLPDSISRASFLTPEERRRAADRVKFAGTGHTEGTRWRWEQMRECLVDPQTWLLVAIALLTQLPNGGTQNFGSLVLTSFGFSPLQTTLLQIPASVIAVVSVALTGWLEGRIRGAVCLLLFASVLPSIIGSSLIYAAINEGNTGKAVPPGVQLFGYFLICTAPATLPLDMSLLQANFKGVTKKMTATALLFVAYCVGNIAGPQLFVAAEAPHYSTAFRAILICYTLVACMSIILRLYLVGVNHRREKGEEAADENDGVETKGTVNEKDASTIQGVSSSIQDGDCTDRQTLGFRYRI